VEVPARSVLKLSDNNVPSRTHWKCALKLRPPAKEVLLKRTETSTRNLERVAMMGRVEVGGCSSHAAVELSQGEAYVYQLKTDLP